MRIEYAWNSTEIHLRRELLPLADLIDGELLPAKLTSHSWPNSDGTDFRALRGGDAAELLRILEEDLAAKGVGSGGRRRGGA